MLTSLKSWCLVGTISKDQAQEGSEQKPSLPPLPLLPLTPQLLEVQHTHHESQWLWSRSILFLKAPVSWHCSFNMMSQLVEPRTEVSFQLLSEKRESIVLLISEIESHPNWHSGKLAWTTKGIQILTRQGYRKRPPLFLICVNTSSAHASRREAGKGYSAQQTSMPQSTCLLASPEGNSSCQWIWTCSKSRITGWCSFLLCRHRPMLKFSFLKPNVK